MFLYKACHICNCCVTLQKKYALQLNPFFDGHTTVAVFIAHGVQLLPNLGEQLSACVSLLAVCRPIAQFCSFLELERGTFKVTSLATSKSFHVMKSSWS